MSVHRRVVPFESVSGAIDTWQPRHFAWIDPVWPVIALVAIFGTSSTTTASSLPANSELFSCILSTKSLQILD